MKFFKCHSQKMKNDKIVYLEDKFTDIGPDVFDGFAAEYIILSDRTQVIRNYAFSGLGRCNIYLPKSITEIEPYAFENISPEITFFCAEGSYAEKVCVEFNLVINYNVREIFALVEEQKKLLEEQARLVEEQARLVEEQARILEEQKRMMEEQRRKEEEERALKEEKIREEKRKAIQEQKQKEEAEKARLAQKLKEEAEKAQRDKALKEEQERKRQQQEAERKAREQEKVNQNTGDSAQYTNVVDYMDVDYQNEELPMKWYKFLIYFAFIVGPIFAFISALSLFSAGAGFKGFLSIILGILQLVARKKLVDFKADAPKLVYWVYGLDIFMAFTSISSSASAVWSIIVGIIILVCNVKYFRRREHLFVN